MDIPAREPVSTGVSQRWAAQKGHIADLGLFLSLADFGLFPEGVLHSFRDSVSLELWTLDALTRADTGLMKQLKRRSLLQLATASMAISGVKSFAQDSAAPRGTIVKLGPLRLYVARPVGAAKMGVIVLPAIAGLNAFTRQTADAFATEGLVGAVWDPYDGEDAPADMMRQLARSKEVTDAAAVSGLRRTVDYLTQELGVTSVCSIGWCLGGRFALIHAGNDKRVGAVASYNPTIYSPTPITMFGQTFSRADFPGQTMDDFATSTAIAGAVQVVRPGHDICQPAEYAKLQAALYARKHRTVFEYYPEAGHGFSYTLNKPEHIAAHRQSWASTLSMFKET